MADPFARNQTPDLHTRGRTRLAAAIAVTLIHLLPIALLSHCRETVLDEPVTPPPLRVALHHPPPRESTGTTFEIRPFAPDIELEPPELQMQNEPEPIPMTPPVPSPQPAPYAPASSTSVPRTASARDCWPYRWLLRMSRTIDSTLRYPTEAHRRGERGTAFVRVSVERSGRVLEAPLIRSSGHPQLDAEARAVIQRIGRFEPLAPGDCIGYDVIVVDQPVRFGR